MSAIAAGASLAEIVSIVRESLREQHREHLADLKSAYEKNVASFEKNVASYERQIALLHRTIEIVTTGERWTAETSLRAWVLMDGIHRGIGDFNPVA